MEVVKDWLLPSKSISHFLVLVHLSFVITFWNVQVILLQEILAILNGGIWFYLRMLNDFIFQWLGTWYITTFTRIEEFLILYYTCGRWRKSPNFWINVNKAQRCAERETTLDLELEDLALPCNCPMNLTSLTVLSEPLFSSVMTTVCIKKETHIYKVNEAVQ